MSKGPLAGARIIELAAIGPVPYAGQVLADMGAEVIVIDKPSRGPVGSAQAIERRGKRSVVVDLRAEGGAEIALRLIESADALIEGFRPGVCERLGLGPEVAMARNPKLVFGRMTGWGQTGPMSAMAGHDLNYIGLTGALHAMGEAGRPPTPPLNLVGDYGGGSMFLATGVLAAMLQAQRTGAGDVVDVAITDCVTSMAGLAHTMMAAGMWSLERQSNLLDGAAPFYRTYVCADGLFVAVGCIEPQFFAAMLAGLGIGAEDFGPQMSPPHWPEQTARLARVFAAEPRDHWAALFQGTDACVTPVLRFDELGANAHMAARGAVVPSGGVTHPGPAPRFADALAPSLDIPADGDATRAVLAEAGYSASEIAALEAADLIRQAT